MSVQSLFLGLAVCSLMTAGLAAQDAPKPGTYDKRAENQQDRIAQGVKSGQLTPRETAKLERKEAKIRKEVKQDRAANGGHMTAAERKQVNQQQNQVSKKIYKDKHNDKMAK